MNGIHTTITWKEIKNTSSSLYELINKILDEYNYSDIDSNYALSMINNSNTLM